MNGETFRKQAEREVGRTPDKRKTAERRANRVGKGRRHDGSATKVPESPTLGQKPMPDQPPPPWSDRRRFRRAQALPSD